MIPIRNDNTHNVTGWCLEVHDLAASKLAAGREKDMEFVAVLLRERLVDVNTLHQRVISLLDKADLAEQRLGSAILKEYSARVQTPVDRVRLETENPGLVNLRDLYYGASKAERLTHIQRRAKDEAGQLVLDKNGDPIEAAERLVQSTRAEVRHDSFEGPYYAPLTDSIHLPSRERFPSAANY
jgi:hypothetical protein